MVQLLFGEEKTVNVLHSPGHEPGTAVTAGHIAARIERLPISAWHIKARVLVGTATFFDAFDALAIAQALPVLVPLWGLTAPESGFLISVSYVGQILGALAFGWMAERFGRLRALALATFIFSIMSLACGFAQNYHQLLIFRAIQGFGLGGEVPIAAAYISEIARAHGRGKFVLLYENIFAFGLVVAGFAGSIIVPRFGWEYMFFIGAVPIVIAPLLLAILPESPRWLATQGKLKEADAAVSQIEAAIEKRSGRPLPPVPAALPTEVQKSSWRDIIGAGAIKKTIVVWTLWFTGYLVYYGLGTWLPTLYRTVFGLSVADSLHYGMYAQLAVFFGSLTCAFVIDWTGRRKLFMIALAGEGISLLILWMIGADSITQVIVFTTIAIYFAGAAGISAYLYTPEVYPTRSRALATALGSAWLRVASVIGPAIVGLLVGQGTGTVLLIFGVIPLIASVIITMFAVETAGRTLEEINK